MNDFPGSCQHSRGRGRLGLLAVLLMFVSVAAAQNPEGHVIPNFKDVELVQLAAAISIATGKSFIIDPRVHARVTMISTTPMSPSAFYEAFLSILQVEGFVAVPSGAIVMIRPRVTARRTPNAAPLVALLMGTSLRDVTQTDCCFVHTPATQRAFSVPPL